MATGPLGLNTSLLLPFADRVHNTHAHGGAPRGTAPKPKHTPRRYSPPWQKGQRALHLSARPSDEDS